jgi:tetratricopeptide (TPR) repeat protein
MLTAGPIEQSLAHAQKLAQAGRMSEAWSAIAPARSAIWSHGQALRLYALIAQNAGQDDEAIAALERIVAIEKAPPEIVGALADTLGKAGRHEEAYRQWSRLVGLDPNAPDAHLNRALAANESGKPELALSAADEGLRRFPGHARLLAARAVALKNAGRTSEALEAFDRAVEADPGRALIYFNRAVTLRAALRFDEACAEFAEAERRGLKGDLFYATWAAAELEAGRVEQSIARYRQVLAANPAHDESLRAMTRIHIEYQTGENPFSHYAALAELRPDDPSAWVEWANALALNRDYAGAARVAADGAKRIPGSAELPLLALFSEGMGGDPAGPAAELAAKLREDPDNELLWATVSQLGLRGGLPKDAEQAALRLVGKYPYHQSAWSILSVAWRVLGDEREQWLCDYERLVMAIDVPSPDGSLAAGEYAAVVAAALSQRHKTLAAPGNQSLRHGTQTGGALFDDPDPAIQQFKEAVSLAAARAVAALPDDPDHPFLSRKATSFGFSGSWSVKLKPGGGHHVPHFHSEGWMSSAYYAALPPADDETRGHHEGWIEFGRPPAEFNLDLPPRRVIEPVEGRLVLFPSYMWHGTVPFGRGERLTAAFDYQPL